MKIKKITCTLLLSVILLAGNCVVAIHDHEDELFLNHHIELKDGVSLSIIDCVSLAFKNSPKVKRQKYNLDIAKSNVGIAKSQYFPIIGAGVGFTYERNSDGIYYDKKFRDLPSVGVSVNQLIWNFGKTTAYIKMEEFYKIAAEYEFMDSLCYTLFDIKAKYYNLLKAKALHNVSNNNVKLNEHFVQISKSKGNPDYTTALLNLSEAKVEHIESENNLNNAKYDLSNAMYIDFQPDYDIENTPTFTYNDDYAYTNNSQKVETKPFTPYVFPFEMSSALDIAYKNSPDLQVLINTKNAMEQSLKYVKRTYLPDLTAGVGYGYDKTYLTHNNGLRVGVNLGTSINLMELKHSIKGADAQLNIADNEIQLFKKDLYYELKRAFNNVERAKKQVPATITEVEESLANLTLVEKEYKQKTLDYNALQIARQDYIKSLQNYIESIYNYNIALIQVEMAMHYHLVDIHHKSDHAVHYHAEELIEHLNKVLECDEKEVNHKKVKKHKK